MAQAYAVQLSRHQDAKFPQLCAICESADPEERVTVRSGVLRWSMLFWPFTGLVSAKVPICQTCAKQFRRRRLLRTILEWTLLSVAVLATFWFFGTYRGPFRKWLLVLVSCLLALPYIIWASMFPPAIELTAFRDHVQYEFTNQSFAAKFAALNRASRA